MDARAYGSPQQPKKPTHRGAVNTGRQLGPRPLSTRNLVPSPRRGRPATGEQSSLRLTRGQRVPCSKTDDGQHSLPGALSASPATRKLPVAEAAWPAAPPWPTAASSRLRELQEARSWESESSRERSAGGALEERSPSHGAERRGSARSPRRRSSAPGAGATSPVDRVRRSTSGRSWCSSPGAQSRSPSPPTMRELEAAAAASEALHRHLIGEAATMRGAAACAAVPVPPRASCGKAGKAEEVRKCCPRAALAAEPPSTEETTWEEDVRRGRDSASPDRSWRSSDSLSPSLDGSTNVESSRANQGRDAVVQRRLGEVSELLPSQRPETATQVAMRAQDPGAKVTHFIGMAVNPLHEGADSQLTSTSRLQWPAQQGAPAKPLMEGPSDRNAACSSSVPPRSLVASMSSCPGPSSCSGTPSSTVCVGRPGRVWRSITGPRPPPCEHGCRMGCGHDRGGAGRGKVETESESTYVLADRVGAQVVAGLTAPVAKGAPCWEDKSEAAIPNVSKAAVEKSRRPTKEARVTWDMKTTASKGLQTCQVAVSQGNATGPLLQGGGHIGQLGPPEGAGEESESEVSTCLLEASRSARMSTLLQTAAMEARSAHNRATMEDTAYPEQQHATGETRWTWAQAPTASRALQAVQSSVPVENPNGGLSSSPGLPPSKLSNGSPIAQSVAVAGHAAGMAEAVKVEKWEAANALEGGPSWPDDVESTASPASSGSSLPGGTVRLRVLGAWRAGEPRGGSRAARQTSWVPLVELRILDMKASQSAAPPFASLQWTPGTELEFLLSEQRNWTLELVAWGDGEPGEETGTAVLSLGATELQGSAPLEVRLSRGGLKGGALCFVLAWTGPRASVEPASPEDAQHACWTKDGLGWERYSTTEAYPSHHHRRLAYRRAECRFTIRRAPHFVGIHAHPAPVTLSGMPPLRLLEGPERARVLLLLEQADEAMKVARGVAASRCKLRFEQELRTLLRDLGGAFAVHARAAEERDFGALGKVPAVLALLVRLVENLDVLVTPEDYGWDAKTFSSDLWGHSDYGSCAYASEVAAALGAGLGPWGFLRHVVDCLRVFGVETRVEGPFDFAAELSLHAALAMRLFLAWVPAFGVPWTCEAPLAQGCQETLSGAVAKVFTNRNVATAAMAAEDLGMVALALDCLRLGLPCGACHVCPGGHNSCESVVTLASLAAKVLECLAQRPLQTPTPGRDISQAADAAAVAAVRLLTTVAELPVKVMVQPEKVACDLKLVVGRQPLSQRLAAAIHHLARKPQCKPRWFKGAAGSDFRRRLRRSLGHANVPQSCAEAALLAMTQFAEVGRAAAPMEEQARNVVDLVARMQAGAMTAATLYAHVEGIAISVHGSAAGSELMSELRALRDDEAASSCVSEGSAAKPPARRSLQSALGRLQQKLRSHFLPPAMD